MSDRTRDAGMNPPGNHLHTIHLNQIQMDEMELEETGCLP
jgi:hypothetical protein